MQDDFDKKLRSLLHSKQYEFRNLRRKELTKESGVYVIWDRESKAGNVPLYVGSSVGEREGLRRRLWDHHGGKKVQPSRKSVFRRHVAVNLLKLAKSKKEAEDLPKNKELAISGWIRDRCYFRLLVCDALVTRQCEGFIRDKLKPTLNKLDC